MPLELPDDQKRVRSEAKAMRSECIAAIREGLADVAAGRTKPAQPALDALAKKYGIEALDRSHDAPGAVNRKDDR